MKVKAARAHDVREIPTFARGIKSVIGRVFVSGASGLARFCATAPLCACLFLSTLMLALTTNKCVHAGQPHPSRMVHLKVPTSPDWPPAAPPIYPVKAADYAGRGVNVGLVEVGYSHGANSPHARALNGVIRAHVLPSLFTDNPHGSIVARIIAGKNIGDGYGGGVAQGSQLYAAQYSAMLPGMAYDELHRFAVNIVNHSWTWEDQIADRLSRMHESGARASIADAVRSDIKIFRRAVIDSEQLLIWSAGNKNDTEVGWPARLPTVVPELKRGWLVVTSLRPDGTLKAPANACGASADWCLGAEEGKAGGAFGTSFAAPIVTGVAALVSEAYGWMDNHALVQTLLSTADSLGPPKIYGWGRVNADRAVRGPALFDARLTFGDDFVADFNRQRSEFFHDIGGDRGLVKKGTGALVLWGKNTYTGRTRVLGGTLELYGRVAGSVYVGPYGTLYSHGGTIGGNLENAGLVRMMGKGLHVQGDYFASGARADVTAPLGVLLTVDGTAYLRGTSWDVVDRDKRYVVQASNPLLKAGKVVGEFDVVTYGLYVKVDVIYTPTEVVVVFGRKNVGDVAQRYFELHTVWETAATAVETSFNAIDQHLQGMPATVSDEFVVEAGEFQHIGSVPELATALDSLTGEAYASSQALSFEHAQYVNRALSDRVDTLSHATQVDGLWINMLGAEGTLREHGYTSATTQLFSAQLGADHRVSGDAIIGAALSWSQANATFSGPGGRTTGRSVGISLYGRYGASNGYYLSGRLGHDWITTDVCREIVIGAIKPINSSRHDGMTSAYVELGHVFSAGAASYTPYLGAEYNLLRRGSIQEGGSAFALRAASAHYQQAALLLGMRYQSAPISWAGGETTLNVGGAYRYSSPTSLAFTAAFNGAPEATFRLRGIGLPQHNGWLSIGASTRVNSRGPSWSFDFDMRFDGKSVHSHAVSVGLRYSLG